MAKKIPEWKRWAQMEKSVSGQASVFDLMRMQKKFGFSDEDMQRIARNEIRTGAGYSKETREKEAAAKAWFDRRFNKDVSTFQDLPDKYKNTPMGNLFNLLRGKKEGQTPDQAAATRDIEKTVEETPVFEQTTVGGQPTMQPDIAQPAATTGGAIAQNAQQVISELVKRIPSYGQEKEIEIPKGATKEEIASIRQQNKEIKTRNAEVKRRGEIIAQGLGEFAPQAISAVQQGAEPIGQFGQPQAEGMLGTYDRLVNLVRPERTGVQKALSVASRFAVPGAAALGGGLGAIYGGPLGGELGRFGGSVLGAGVQAGLRKLAQPDPEFSGIGRMLAGTGPGMFTPGQRGLAGLIAGETPRSRIGSLFGLLPARQATGRFAGLRRALGGGVRAAGQFIGAPGRAGQLRDALQVGQAIYELGGELGLGRLARGLGERLGLVSRSPRLGGSLEGMGMAASILPSAYEFMVPELQRQAQGYLGYATPAQSVVGDLDRQMLAALGPQIAEQSLTASKIRGKGQRLGAQRRAQAAAAPIQQASNLLAQQQQQQKFQRAAQMGGLKALGEGARAQLGAQRGRLAMEEIAAGQPLRVYPALAPVPAFGDVPEVLQAVGTQVAGATQPYAQEYIQQAFSSPSKTKLSKK